MLLFTDAVNLRYFSLSPPKSPMDQKDSLVFSNTVTFKEQVYHFGDGISSWGGGGSTRFKIYCVQQMG